MRYSKSIVGSTIAFIIATSCCWLPALLVAIGSGSTLVGISHGLEKYSWLFMLFGFGLLGLGIYQYKNRISNNSTVILNSILTCPECGHKSTEVMPTNACQYFHECASCTVILKPQKSDCCVFCSYGTVPCPPIQLDQDCC